MLFRSAYDAGPRKERGVWYTPIQVVRFIVAAADWALRTRFALPDGLADNSKVDIEVEETAFHGKKLAQKVNKTVHRVQLLDPALGTGTFLAEAVRQIFAKFAGNEGLWPGYDAVSSSRFITQKKSEQLVKKLTELASVNQKSELKRHLYATNRVKTSNESIFYTVDTINQAITQKRKITFKYTEYDGEKNIVFRNCGEVYELSPYALFWNEDYYYVVGYSEKHGNVSVFRVDRLYKPEITKKDAAEKPDDFNLDDYSRQIFEMYDGEMVKVQIKCKNELMKYVIDRFGENVKTRVLSDSEFTAEMEVALSPNFYAWVFRFGGAIKILAPEKAVDEITEMAKAMIE